MNPNGALRGKVRPPRFETEIDDAFSVRSLANGNLEIGIHIAAPGLGFAPGADR